MLTLNILISTIDSGINNTKNIVLPFREEVSYIVSHQYTDERFKVIPDELRRQDIFVSQIAGKGLTISRNNAINLAKADVCLIADDDVSYTDEYFDRIIEAYINFEDMEVGCFKIRTHPGQAEYKEYPKVKKKIDSLSYSPSSIEVTFRTRSIKELNIYFDSRFGLGSPLIGGEESVFLHDCIKKGLIVYFVPEYIVEHPAESSTKILPKYHQARNKVGGAIDYRINGKTAILRAFYLPIKLFPDLIKHKKNPILFLSQRLSGIMYLWKTKSV